MRTPQVGDQVAIEGGRHAGKVGRYVRNDLVQSGQTRLYPVVALEDGAEVRVTSVVVADPEKCCDRGPRTAAADKQWHHMLCPVGKGGTHGQVVAEWNARLAAA